MMGKTNGIIYALVFGLQKTEIESCCFQKCGKIIFGILMDEEMGGLGVCREPDCPYEEGVAELGECEGEPVWVRKLVPLNDGVEERLYSLAGKSKEIIEVT